MVTGREHTETDLTVTGRGPTDGLTTDNSTQLTTIVCFYSGDDVIACDDVITERALTRQHSTSATI